MEPERTLLEQISDKEGELKIQTERVYREAEGIVAQAREKASHIIEEAETEGKIKTDEICGRELAYLHREIEEIKQEGLKKAIGIKDQGEGNLRAALEKIVEVVVG